MTDRKTLTFALMDPPFESARSTTALRLIDAALRRGHNVNVFAYEGAVHLAGNAAAKNQAFRIGRAAYGTQFHFEVDRTVAAWWRDTFPEQIERMAPGWIGQFDEIADAYGPAADTAGLAIARAWVATIAAGSVAGRGKGVSDAA